jgi:hypothetical protein
MLHQGDAAGVIAWDRIVRAIEELQRDRRADESLN